MPKLSSNLNCFQLKLQSLLSRIKTLIFSNFNLKMKSIFIFITAIFIHLSLLFPSYAQTNNTLNISKPNGYAGTVVDDFKHKSALGVVRWLRVWDGFEWKFNPHWESLSTSWGNLTGSQSANTTVGDLPIAPGTTIIGVDKPPTNQLISRPEGSSGGTAEGCWAWVDEDWQPTYSAALFYDPEDPAVTMEREAGPMIPLRSTPFNRGIQGDSENSTIGSEYAASRTVSIDYATLCAGSSQESSVIKEYEGIRRSNELYIGTSGRYAFNNRSILEKRPVKQLLTASTASQYASIATGKIAASVLDNPVLNPKGYRWMDKSGDWTDYNTQGQVVAFGDKNNNIIWLLRDTNGLLIAVLDANGGKVLYSLHYTGQLLTKVKDYNIAATEGDDQPNRSVNYEYDDKNRLIKVKNSKSEITSYSYDKRNRIIKITDPESRIEKFGYIGDTTRRRTAADGGVSDYVFEYDDVSKQFTSKYSGPETTAGRTSVVYTHNRVGKLVGLTVNGRTELHIKYDTGNRSEVRTNARGFSTRIIKNEYDQVVTIDRADGTTTSRAFSALHLGLVKQTDELGVSNIYEYDDKGNLTKSRQAVGTNDEIVTDFTPNSNGLFTSITRKGRTEVNGSITPDATWQIDYDATGQIKKTIDPEGGIRKFVYDRDGNLRKYTDPNDKTSTFHYDEIGRLIKFTDALGREYNYQYDKVGNLIKLTDARSKVYQAVYDAMNRNTKTIHALGGVVKTQYNSQGMPISETDEDGRVVRAEFDNFLRVTQQIDGLGNSTQYSYNIPDGSSSGMIGSLFDPTEIKYPTYTERLRYDQLERQTSETILNPTSLGTEGLVSAAQYDKRGFITSEVNPNGKNRFYTRNALGQLVEITDSLGNKTKTSYDTRGNLIELVDAKNNVTKFKYDRLSRLVKEELPLGQTTLYTYDKAGNLKERIDPNGKKTSIEYNGVNLPIQVKQYNSNDLLVRTISFTRDATDNVTSWSDTDHTRPNGQQTSSANITYDDNGSKLTETVSYPNPEGNNVSFTYAYKYSLSGNKTQIIWPDGTPIDYSYSQHNQLQSVAIPGEGSISVASYKWIAPTKTTLPGGTVQERTLDGLLNLESLKVKNPGQQTILNLTNTYGKEQEIKSSSRSDTAGGISNSKVSTYSHDDEIRLTQVKNETGTLFGNDVETFTLDAVGNRVAHSKVSGAWTYDLNNQLTRIGDGTCGVANTVCYEYDNAGNQTQKHQLGKLTQYVYDIQDRLIEVADITNGNTANQRKIIARYGYDPLNRRLWKEQYADRNATPILQPKRTYYLYSDEGLIAEATQNISLQLDGSVTANQAPNITTQYGVMPDSNFSTGVLFIKTKNSLGLNTVAYYHHDHLQTPLQATDKAGNIVWSATYNVFGQAIITTPSATELVPTIESNLRLPGQYEDTETGLHYNFNRYYDPQTGRYISQDPIGLAGGINRFSYVNHNPLNNFDPLGLWALGDPLDPTLVNFTAGFGDGMLGLVTFGFWDGNAARKLLDIGSVDSCSAAYGYGEIAGEITGSLILARAGPKKPNPCGFNSFTGETLVSVKPENAQQTEALNGKVELKPISQIVVGDEVLAFSEWRDKGEISNQDQRLSYEKVTDVYTSYKQQVLVHLSLDNGATITATEGHPFKTDEGWRDAIMLKKGGKLLLKDGGEEEANNQLLLQPKVDDKNTLSATQSGLPTSDSTRTITGIRLEKKVVAVYNLEVANAHTFFVGEDGVLVHNSGPGIYIDYGDYDGDIGHYVGQSNDMDRRLKQHQKHPKKKNHTRQCEIPMPGSSQRDRDRMENFIYHTFAEWGWHANNKRRPPNKGK